MPDPAKYLVARKPGHGGTREVYRVLARYSRRVRLIKAGLLLWPGGVITPTQPREPFWSDLAHYVPIRWNPEGIPQDSSDEPSFWFVEGYSVGYYDTALPDGLGDLPQKDRDEFHRGRHVGLVRYLNEMGEQPTMIEPTRKYRTIRGEAANHKVAYYETEEARDKAADRDAERDTEDVMCELWSPDHPQDDLNRGWAMDRVAYAKRAPVPIDAARLEAVLLEVVGQSATEEIFALLDHKEGDEP